MAHASGCDDLNVPCHVPLYVPEKSGSLIVTVTAVCAVTDPLVPRIVSWKLPSFASCAAASDSVVPCDPAGGARNCSDSPVGVVPTVEKTTLPEKPFTGLTVTTLVESHAVLPGALPPTGRLRPVAQTVKP